MKSQSSGIGWLLVFGMAMMGLSAMPDDPPAIPARPPVTRHADHPKKTPQSSQPPDVTCDGDSCWWTDLGRPNR